MKLIKVVHCKESRYDVLICRGTPFGNPFTHKKGNTLAKWVVKTRKESIEKFREWLINSQDDEAKYIRDNLHTLKGKTLGCYCKSKHNPKACHGDVYALMLDDHIIDEFM